MITMKPRKKWNYSRNQKKKLDIKVKTYSWLKSCICSLKALHLSLKCLRLSWKFNRSLSIMSNTVSLREAYFQLPVFFSGNFKVTVIDWHHAGEIMWQSGRWSGGVLRYIEINRNIKESHKKKTWTFRLIVFWGALWMAIYSLPFPPSLWRKLFCKLIIQICQNARIRTIYMAEILFVVSTR